MKKSVTTLGCAVMVMIAISSLKPLKVSGEEVNKSLHATNSLSITQSVNTETIQSLQQQLEEKTKALEALEKLLFAANADAEASQRELESRKRRDAALGLEALTGDEKRMQEQLVTTLGSLYRSEQERKQAFEALAKVITRAEDLLPKMKLASQDKQAFEKELAQAKEVISSREKQKQSVLNVGLLNAEVIGYETKLNLIVLNVGWAQDVKPSMIFEVLKDDKVIALCRIVDVRKRLSGALIEKNFESEIEVGNKARVKLVKLPKLEK
ncbi:MAG: hypothetical protein R3F23_04150 [Verrucomicrobiia bacterium]